MVPVKVVDLFNTHFMTALTLQTFKRAIHDFYNGRYRTWGAKKANIVEVNFLFWSFIFLGLFALISRLVHWHGLFFLYTSSLFHPRLFAIFLLISWISSIFSSNSPRHKSAMRRCRCMIPGLKNTTRSVPALHCHLRCQFVCHLQ